METSKSAQIVKNFAIRFCAVDNDLISTLEKNYKSCYTLAEKWADGLKDYLDPNASDSLAITDVSNALTATLRIVDLIKTGNECRDNYLNARFIQDPDLKSKPPFSRITDELRTNYFSSTGQPQKINSIKRVRELTNCGLKEAKEFVDAFVESDEIMIRNATIKDVMT